MIARRELESRAALWTLYGDGFALIERPELHHRPICAQLVGAYADDIVVQLPNAAIQRKSRSIAAAGATRNEDTLSVCLRLQWLGAAVAQGVPWARLHLQAVALVVPAALS